MVGFAKGWQFEKKNEWKKNREMVCLLHSRLEGEKIAVASLEDRFSVVARHCHVDLNCIHSWSRAREKPSLLFFARLTMGKYTISNQSDHTAASTPQ